MDFGYGTVMTSVQAIFGTNQDIGKGISDLLVNQLVNDGTYRVFERAALDKIINEQNFSNSNRADPATAAKIGALAGVDTIIIGDITTFGRDDKNYGGGAVGYGLGKFGVGGLGVHKAKAVVEITARIVDVNTGEILASVTGHGESKRSGTDMLGGGGGWGGGGGGHLDMGSSNFGQTIIGEATKSSVTEVATRLDGKVGSLPTIAAAASGAGRWAGGGCVERRHHHQRRVGRGRESRRHAGGDAGSADGERPGNGQSAADNRYAGGNADDHERGCDLGGGQVHRDGQAGGRGPREEAVDGGGWL